MLQQKNNPIPLSNGILHILALSQVIHILHSIKKNNEQIYYS